MPANGVAPELILETHKLINFIHVHALGSSLQNIKMDWLVSRTGCLGARYQGDCKLGLDTGETEEAPSWLLEGPGVQASDWRDCGLKEVGYRQGYRAEPAAGKIHNMSVCE